MARIAELWRYPLKGARGIRVRELEVDPIVGPRKDRRAAVEMPFEQRTGKGRKYGPLEARMHHSKSNFFVGMNTPLMVAQEPVYDSFMAATDGDGALSSEYLVSLAKDLKQSELTIHYSDGKTISYHDTKGAFVSIGNIATLRAFEEYAGMAVDAQRFRMNVWLDGLEPFEEYHWIDTFPGTRELLAPLVTFRGHNELERCPAINANIDTGEFDVLPGDDDTIFKKLRAFMLKRNHKSPENEVAQVMGILVAPLADGVIEINDEIWPK